MPPFNMNSIQFHNGLYHFSLRITCPLLPEYDLQMEIGHLVYRTISMTHHDVLKGYF